MKTNNEGVKLIKEFESLHDGDLTLIGLQPKMDPIGIWTEGYGRAMRDKKGNFIKGAANKKLAYDNITIKTVAEALIALTQDLSPREEIVSQNIKIPLTTNQFSALVSYVYNTGGSSTLYRLINNKASDKEIRTWFETKYITADGKTLPGLIRRRKAEADLYFKK
jgi:lysozyme